jgi:hypothetical protein
MRPRHPLSNRTRRAWAVRPRGTKTWQPIVCVARATLPTGSSSAPPITQARIVASRVMLAVFWIDRPQT